jgi:hypothetical protein
MSIKSLAFEIKRRDRTDSAIFKRAEAAMRRANILASVKKPENRSGFALLFFKEGNSVAYGR